MLTTAPLYKPDDGIEKFATLALEYNPNIRITVEQIWLRRGDATEPVPRDYPHTYKSVDDYNTATIADLRERSAPMFESIDGYVAEQNNKFGKPVLFVVPAGQAVIGLREDRRRESRQAYGAVSIVLRHHWTWHETVACACVILPFRGHLSAQSSGAADAKDSGQRQTNSVGRRNPSSLAGGGMGSRDATSPKRCA